MRVYTPAGLSSRILGLGLGLLAGGAAQATLPTLSDTPLFIQQGADPNIIISIDDSDSMLQCYLPRAMQTKQSQVMAVSSHSNKLYFDPDAEYPPPVDSLGVSLGDSTFKNAWINGLDIAGRDSCTMNLGEEYRALWSGFAGNCDETWNPSEWSEDPARPEDATDATPRPAFYYVYDEEGCGDEDNAACYTRHTIETDGSGNPVDADLGQRFANWFSYYHSRILLAKTAMGRAMSEAGDSIRLSYQLINDEHILPTVPRSFSGDARSDFYSWLYGIPADIGGTPTIAATIRAGEFLSQEKVYREDPDDSTTGYYCRQNFHLLVTDGESDEVAIDEGVYLYSPYEDESWDGDASKVIPVPQPKDAGNDYEVDEYVPRTPFMDSYPGFLADIAFKYWITDLLPGDDAPNNVATDVAYPVYTDDGSALNLEATFWDPRNNPASWQHMVNYTIGLGMTGSMDYPGVRGEDDPDWVPLDHTWNADLIDDLWHAAINSRGAYFSAQDPAALTNALDELIPPQPPKQSTGAAAVALNTGSLAGGSRIYQPTFYTGSWVGRIRAYDLCFELSDTCTTLGDVADEPTWDTADIFDNNLVPNNRNIVSYDPVTEDGVRFRWSGTGGLSDAQKALLDGDDGRGENRLDYIRGDTSNEQVNENDGFRERKLQEFGAYTTNVLGDVINSGPIYVDKPGRFYPSDLENASYSSFKSAQATRPEVIYFGSNDGMLHALKASDGEEVFAYVPNQILSKLVDLSDPEQPHIPLVDGPLTEGDIFDGTAWKTFLIGTLGGGGQAVYALDITSPVVSGDGGTVAEGRATDFVQWEFSDEDDADLGYLYGAALLVKAPTPEPTAGKWVAVFGNGFNNTYPDDDGACDDEDDEGDPDESTLCTVSTTGHAALYVVDVTDKSQVTKISTDTGTVAAPNAITDVAAADIDADYDADYVYAGDLFGNLWRFDLATSSATKIFIAKDSDGTPQPITKGLKVIRHPTGVGVLVLFGTGKYVFDGDELDTQVQTWYTIWDKLTVNPSLVVRSTNLLQQTITGQKRHEDGLSDIRVTSDNTIDWNSNLGCYLDFTTETGERVNQTPIVRDDRVVFVTVTPNANPCDSYGASWVMELQAKDCSRLDSISPFDYNNDGAFTEDDYTDLNPDDANDETLIGSGIRLPNVGVLSAPTIMTIPGEDRERKFFNSSDGQVVTLDESQAVSSKIPWREVR